MLKLITLMAIPFFVVSCNEDTQKEKAQSFETLLETKTGQSYTLAKTGKYSVYKNDLTGEFVAYNLDKFEYGVMLSFDEYLANSVVDGVDIVGNLSVEKEWKETGHYEYYNNDCRCWRSYQSVGDGAGKKWVDTSYWATYYVGSGYKFANNSVRSKDLETLAAIEENQSVESVAAALKSEFSLSDNRAQELATLANKYRKLESARALTASEKDQFAMKALGVSMTQVEQALLNKALGEEDQYESLLRTAARTNNTTPEQIGKFLNGMISE